MRKIFADTYYYIALLSREDRQRKPVEAIAGTIRARTVTSEWVLVEVANALADPATRSLYTALATSLRNNALVEVQPMDAELQRRGEELYAGRPDKGWSLTDCISFIIMNDRQIKEALTADHHFEQAGFVAMLK